MNTPKQFKYYHFNFVYNGKKYSFSLWDNSYELAFNRVVELAKRHDIS